MPGIDFRYGGYCFTFDPLDTNWSYRLTGEESALVSELVTENTRFMVNAAYFRWEPTPVALGVNYFDGESINIHGDDGRINPNIGDVARKDYDIMQVLFYDNYELFDVSN